MDEFYILLASSASLVVNTDERWYSRCVKFLKGRLVVLWSRTRFVRSGIWEAGGGGTATKKKDMGGADGHRFHELTCLAYAFGIRVRVSLTFPRFLSPADKNPAPPWSAASVWLMPILTYTLNVVADYASRLWSRTWKQVLAFPPGDTHSFESQILPLIPQTLTEDYIWDVRKNEAVHRNSKFCRNNYYEKYYYVNFGMYMMCHGLYWLTIFLGSSTLIYHNVAIKRCLKKVLWRMDRVPIYF